MTNIFFGKISQHFDVNQIEEGYYQADKGSSWFGKLNLKDYVYVIGGGRIQFWQADRWEKNEGKDRLYFKILNKNLGIGINDFISLNFFRLTIPLLVKTVRSTGGSEKCAFFDIDMLDNFSEAQLADEDFYKDNSLYRKIRFVDEANISPASSDVQLYLKNDKLKLYKASFLADDVFKKFVDNRKFEGRGQRIKDKTIHTINEGLSGNAIIERTQLNLRNLYDAFFCNYKEKEIGQVVKEEEINEMENQFISNITSLLKQKKNLILQGAPGTGKTYRTAEIAVGLCNGADALPHKREDLMTEYKKLLDEGRIVFTTFHQSLDYEEFVEGIKPSSAEEGMTYDIKPGIFRLICEKAAAPILQNNDLQIRENPTIWKVSLLGTGNNYVREECMKNGHIRIGWDQYGENVEAETNKSGKFILDAFINKMQIGDIVMSCYSQRTVDAIGVVVGEYEWHDEYDHYKRCRKVKWLVKGINQDIYDMNRQAVMVANTVYRLNNLSLENVMTILESHGVAKKESIQKNTKPYVLIIDEINRGNISKILGELITLLEVDKRLGEINEIKVRLPYSQEEFSIPSNLYILGTMNTADRSLGYIDYAVRRRFAFKTLLVDKNVIENFYENDELREKVITLFESIQHFVNDHIECDLTAEELMLGHSYFLAKDRGAMCLKLEYEIIPLLKEYVKDGILRIDEKSLNESCKQWVEML